MKTTNHNILLSNKWNGMEWNLDKCFSNVFYAIRLRAQIDLSKYAECPNFTDIFYISFTIY